MLDMNILKPLISVIMPVCNETLFFEDAIESILSQTETNFEVLIIDSSDNKTVINNILPNDRRIRYYYREKNGISDALNYGIIQARGEYIARMDADDVALPQRFSMQVQYLQTHTDVDVLGTWFRFIDENGLIVGKGCPPETNENIFANLVFDNPICHPSVMYRRRVFDEGNRYPYVKSEDYAMWLMLISHYHFANIPQFLMLYRLHNKNSTKQNSNKVNNSVELSAKKFAANIFGIPENAYSNEAWIRNYQFERLCVTYKSRKTEFLLEEIKLIWELSHKNTCIDSSSMINEIYTRLMVYMRVADCFTDEMRSLYQIIILAKRKHLDIFDCLQREYNLKNNLNEYLAWFKVIFDKNFEIRNKLMKRTKNFFLYGMGADGKMALQKYIYLKKNNLLIWKLVGCVDQKEFLYEISGKWYKSVTPKELTKNDFDLILISSAGFYDEIRRNLIQMGISIDKIYRDSVLYQF